MKWVRIFLLVVVGLFLSLLLIQGCKVKQTEEVEPPSDTPPELTLTFPQPLENETLCGVVEITADAQGVDGKTISKVEFYVDDVLLPDGTDTSAPYSCTWDTSTVQVTAHTIKVIAYDNLNYTAEVSRQVNVWCGVEKSPMPTQRYYFSSHVVDGKIYVVGGYNPDAGNAADAGGSGVDNPDAVPVFDVVEVYDPVTDAWTSVSPIPNSGRAAHAGCVIDGKIYIFGGDEGYNWVPYVEEYDPVTDTWTSKTPIPRDEGMGIGMFTCAAMHGNAYISGGFAAENAAAVGEYNPVRDRWRIKTGMNIGRHDPAGCTFNGEIYVFGGCPERAAAACGNPLDSVEKYDPVTDAWTILPTVMPTPRYKLSCCVLNGKIFLIGGAGVQADGMTTIEEYDPATNTWGPRLPMPMGQRDFGTAVVNGKIYIIGSGMYEYTPGF
jgi:hypothetical protein